MSDYYSIESKLSGHVSEIVGASTKSGALLDAYTLQGKDNKLWEFVADPGQTGHFFIQSKLSGHCVDIQHDSNHAGAALEVFPAQNSGKPNQLWAFNPDPTGSGFYFIRSLSNGNVIDIKRASKEAGAGLDAYPQKNDADADKLLWKVVE